ncbi:MAG TPA: hypothetical protein VFE05_20115 [Longimicrobiaceae bacterium]|nr:hypothetical protein [Longimicrobiaceae bacterium]
MNYTGPEFYEKLYETEWVRRDQIQGSASAPLGVLTLLGGGLLVLVQHFDHAPRQLAVVFWPVFAVAVAAFVLSGWSFVRSVHGYTYRQIPLPSVLSAYFDGLKAHHESAGTPGLASAEFEKFLKERYIEAADRNAVNNVNRGEYLYKATRALIFSLVAAAIASIPVAIQVSTAPARPQEVRIINLEGSPMPQVSAPQVSAHIVPKPIPPSNFDVKTGMKVPQPKK